MAFPRQRITIFIPVGQGRMGDFGRVSSLYINKRLLCFSAKEETTCYEEDKLKVLADGSCIWYREFQMSVTHCPMDVKWFPFDDQRCELKFQSRTRESKELNVIGTPAEGTGVGTAYETSGEWELMGSCLLFIIVFETWKNKAMSLNSVNTDLT